MRQGHAAQMGRCLGGRQRTGRGLLFSVLLFCCLLAACERTPLADDYSEARSAAASHEWTRAERLLERFLREAEDPDKRWEAWQLLLTVANATGVTTRVQLEYLDTMLEEFADSDARCKDILRRMGRLTERQRRYERAVDIWSAYLDLEGLSPQDSVEGYRHLAAMNFRLHRYEAAEDALQQCLALPADDGAKLPCMYDLADQSAARERWQEAADLSQQILDSHPDDKLRGMTLFLFADALEQLDRPDEALTHFEQAREIYPNPDVVENRVAYLKKKMKNPSRRQNGAGGKQTTPQPRHEE